MGPLNTGKIVKLKYLFSENRILEGIVVILLSISFLEP